MAEGNEQQLRFHPIDGCTVRADFDGGAMSSDFGPMLLRVSTLPENSPDVLE